MKSLAFGEVLWDIYPQNKYIGGAPLNFAAHFVRCGGEAYMLSAVGDDELADETVEAVESYGVNTDFIAVNNGGKSGCCLVSIDKNGNPTYELLPCQAYDKIPFNSRLREFKWDLFYFGTLAMRDGDNKISVEKVLYECSIGNVAVDLNLRGRYYDDSILEFALSKANILKANEEELRIASEMLLNNDFGTESNVKALAEMYQNLRIIIVTNGEKGSLAYSDGKFFRCNIVPTDIVSTVGAGDAFFAAFCAAYLSGSPIQSCLEKAAKLSSYVVSKYDAIPM